MPVKKPPRWKKQVVATMIESDLIMDWSDPRMLRMEKCEWQTPFGRPRDKKLILFYQERWNRKGVHPLTLFTHFKPNTKSIVIHTVLRCCVLLINLNKVKVIK